MTVRSVAIGLLLGTLVSVATYFNDWVIGQTQLIGNHLPISVFGAALFLLLAVNPLLFLLKRQLPLTGREIAVITAIGLAACGWPGSNFYRGFSPISAMPAHWYKTRADWQSTNVMSYVPGASDELGQGQIQDFRRLTRTMIEDDRAGKASVARALWRSLGPAAQRMFNEAFQSGNYDIGRFPQMTRSLNEALHEPDLLPPAVLAKVDLGAQARRLLTEKRRGKLADWDTVRLNRLALVAAMPKVFLPPPEGEGALVDHGRADPVVVDALLQGRSRDNRLSVTELPWAAWWPTIRLWGGLAMALALASLCVALIVHPQWSKRELLPYPIARFVSEIAERREGAPLPDVLRDRLFWVGFLTLVGWHLINGLHAWFEQVPEIPRHYDFWALQTLFPNASRVWGVWAYYSPTLYLSVIAFSFFLSTSVSFSLGIAQMLMLIMGSILIANGYSLDVENLGGKKMNMVRFGAYLGIALIILYTGRRYYKNVLTSALGARRAKETPRYATWAARGLGVCILVAALVLHGSGLSWVVALSFVLLCMLMFLVLTRVVTETGVFFIQSWWTPVGVIAALVGFDALGPTTFFLLAIASVMLTVDPRELLLPYLANGLHLVDRSNAASPAKISWPVLGMIVSGFFMAGVVTLYLQYNYSIVPVGNDWALKQLPVLAFDRLAHHLSEAAAQGTLASATGAHGLARLGLIHPSREALLWAGIGLALVLATSVARLRLSWWPLHPVAFLVWGTYPNVEFAASFLLGWLVKLSVVGTTGAKGYHTVRPLMVGVIAGELLAGLFWMIVGAVYFFVTHKAPHAYSIFPG